MRNNYLIGRWVRFNDWNYQIHDIDNYYYYNFDLVEQVKIFSGIFTKQDQEYFKDFKKGW